MGQNDILTIIVLINLRIKAFGFFCLEYLRSVQSLPVFPLVPAFDFALGTVDLAIAVHLAIFLVFVAAVVVSVVAAAAAAVAFAVVFSVTAVDSIAAAILPALVSVRHIYPLD